MDCCLTRAPLRDQYYSDSTHRHSRLRAPLPWSLASVFFILLAFVLSSSRTHSQYFDIGESQSAPSALKGEDCSLPSAWEGNWFQSGVHGLISIHNRSIISGKGQCIETDGDKFLFYNPSDKCFRCVVFHEKHKNVLQYKETYCQNSRGSLRSICSTIQADYHLMSMFRLDATPVPCPFNGSFTLSYNRGYGNCQLPVSTMNSCLQPTRLVFNYQACPDIHGTESATEEVECFATWRESSSRYLLGLIRYHYTASYEERFRCFVYEKENGHHRHGPSASSLSLHGRRASGSGSNKDTDADEVFRVAQSGDATCLGLTPSEGSKTLVLRKATQRAPCQFPSWLLRHARWESLNREMIYEFEGSRLRISNYSSSSGVSVGNGDGDGLLTQAVCTQIIQRDEEAETHGHVENEDADENKSTNQATRPKNNSENLTDKITLVLHSTTAECQTGYMCVAIYKRDTNIVEIQFGRLSRTLESACQESHFDPDEAAYVTLTSPTPESRECPFLTTFDISSMNSVSVSASETGSSVSDSDCQRLSEGDTIGSFSMGCDKLDTIELATETNCVDGGKLAEKYKCLGWWEAANGENYLVVSSANNSSLGGRRGLRRSTERRSCFVFYETTPSSQLGELSSLSLLHSSSHGRKNQEINLAELARNDDDDDDGDDKNENDYKDEDDDDNTRTEKVQDKESQQKQNVRRQFHFVRFEESCERRPRPQPRQQTPTRKVVDDEFRIGLVFNASTSYYYENNCHTAASRSKAGSGGRGGATSNSNGVRHGSPHACTLLRFSELILALILLVR